MKTFLGGYTLFETIICLTIVILISAMIHKIVAHSMTNEKDKIIKLQNAINEQNSLEIILFKYNLNMGLNPSS